MSKQNGDAGAPVAFVHGCDNSLGRAVCVALAQRGVRIVTQADPRRPAADGDEPRDIERPDVGHVALDARPGETEADLVTRAAAVHGRLDLLVNICVPRPETTAGELAAYPTRLLDRSLQAGSIMAAAGGGAIVNHCFLPSMYAGTSLDAFMPMVKGAITGVTRLLCRRLGQHGVRVNTVQTGLMDVPEAKSFVTPEVLRMNTPVGRWGTATEVARFVRFLALDAGYMTGQAVIMDGGMTAGNTGT